MSKFSLLSKLKALLTGQTDIKGSGWESTDNLHQALNGINDAVSGIGTAVGGIGSALSELSDIKGSGWESMDNLHELLDSLTGISIIKSIQRGEKTLAGADLSDTVTISAVDTTKALIFITNTGSQNDNRSSTIKAVLTNSTTIVFSRYEDASSYDLSIAWQVVEFN